MYNVSARAAVDDGGSKNVGFKKLVCDPEYRSHRYKTVIQSKNISAAARSASWENGAANERSAWLFFL